MRIVFLGTGEIGLPTLRALIAAENVSVVGVVTQPDKPVGRKQVITAPEVKTLALSHGIPVIQPKRVRKAEALAEIAAWDADVMVVMAYGQILPKALLEMPRIACVNLHASLLPRHRGAAPIQAAIRDGDKQSGMTIMHVAEGLDTGDIILQHPFDLAADETGQSLHDRLAEAGPEAILEALEKLESGTATRTVQDEDGMTHTGKLDREDGLLGWNESSEVLERLIRAYDPWPGTLTHFAQGDRRRRLKVFPPTTVVSWPEEAEESVKPGTAHVHEGDWIVRTGDSGLILSDVQLERETSDDDDAILPGTAVAEGLCL